MLKVKLISSLEKVFEDIEPSIEIDNLSILKKEKAAFQVAIYSSDDVTLNIQIESLVKDNIRIRKVEQIYAKRLHIYEDDDNFVIFKDKKERNFPDLLRPIDNEINVKGNAWTSLYIDFVDADKEGRYPIVINLLNKDIVVASKTFNLKVINQTINLDLMPLNTMWMHEDGVASFYNLRVFSKKYNQYLLNFMKSQREHGINILYVPLFTPPLDTQIGKYRTTVQLVDVTLVNDKYIFDFTRVFDFINLGKKLGFKVFEMSHLATQWGAKCSPKIIVNVNGKKQRLFGWKDKTTEDKYLKFITQFLTEFVKELKKRSFKKEEILFHISDEPNQDSVENYSRLYHLFHNCIKPYKTFDALSSYEYYEKGVVDEPVVSLLHVDEYRKHNKDTFVYYCCCECKFNLPNRFFNMPLLRLRVLGPLMYLDNAKGFLQWGFNFYNSQLSISHINPFVCPDADAKFPAGDAFIVYPGKNGEVYDSIRSEQYLYSLQDYALLKMLEQKENKEMVNALLKEFKFNSYNDYSKSEKEYIEFKAKLVNLLDQ